MKTPMQELIDNLTGQLDKVMKEHQTELDKPTYWRGIKNALETSIELAQLFSEKEKEQIVDAHIEGQRVFDDYSHTQWTNDQAEFYYNETFNNKEK